MHQVLSAEIFKEFLILASLAKTRIGIIGCGNISGVYFQAGKRFENLEVVACSDLDISRAKARAAEFEVPVACSPQDLLKRPEVDIIVNLTIPKAHAEIALAALEHGKHTYSEKPFGVNKAQGQAILSAAKAKNLRVGCAPDTFLGGGIQTCRKIIDDGWIGEPIAATAHMACHGHETWHPDPDFYYQPGGGPMFDMGPYYLTALINLIGPVRRVCGTARATFGQRRITSKPKFGTMIEVNTPTHVAGVMDFCNGAIGTILTSFDIWHHQLPIIEIYGTTGTLQVPDPNGFGGVIRIRRMGAADWATIPLAYGYQENSRGLGVADMAAAIKANRPHRANGELAFHVLELMQGFLDASREQTYVQMKTQPDRPAALPLNLVDGKID